MTSFPRQREREKQGVEQYDPVCEKTKHIQIFLYTHPTFLEKYIRSC